MNLDDKLALETVDLTNCDRELIHIPGLIQPHGVLLVLQEPDLKILQVSANTASLLHRRPEDLLHQSLHILFPEDQIQPIYQCLQREFETVNPLHFSMQNSTETLYFDGVLHSNKNFLILELEPLAEPRQNDFFQFYHRIRPILNHIQKTRNLQELYQVVATEVQKLTGFDRVMVYQFNEEGSGCVVAEKAVENLTPYLGLNYPASDIPKQARHLYTLNWLRIIPDVHYQPIGFIPSINPQNSEPLDLSLSVLRSVSPLHIEYLNNMGVRASMSISLMHHQKLWGLIACHHQSPKYINYETRTICEFVGQVMSLELGAKEEAEDLDYQLKLKLIQSKLIETLSQSDNLIDSLVKEPTNLIQLTGSQGVAICINNHFICFGKTPSKEQIQNLIEWVNSQAKTDLFYTDSLALLYPRAEEFKDIGSGLLALTLAKVQKNYILWFRPEVLQTVDWGGNPLKPVEITEDGMVRMSPRKSFEKWQETVRLKSLPWRSCEKEGALELKKAILEIVLRKADELAKINFELERINDELDAFAYIASHDLKEPLRGIHNYSNFLIEDYSDLLDEEGVYKLKTLARLTHRMENLIDSLLHFSRLGRAEFFMQETDLNSILEHIVDVLKMSFKDISFEIVVPRLLPHIECDSVQVSEVFSNLISNAIKYNEKQNRRVEVGFLENISLPSHFLDRNVSHSEDIPTNPPVFYVKDNGIGIRDKHLDAIFRIFKRLHTVDKFGGGTGAGLTIAKKIVERHGGKIWVESNYGEGSTFYFTLQHEWRANE